MRDPPGDFGAESTEERKHRNLWGKLNKGRGMKKLLATQKTSYRRTETAKETYMTNKSFHEYVASKVTSGIFKQAAGMAAIPTTVFVVLSWYRSENPTAFPDDLFPKDIQIIASANTWVLGFVLVFRTGQAYNRFWQGTLGVYKLLRQWFTAASMFCACASTSKVENEKVRTLQGKVIRLFSLLFACALRQISEVPDESFHVIDIFSIDDAHLECLENCEHIAQKTEIIAHWVQMVMLEGMHSSDATIHTPPPVVSNGFALLHGGLDTLTELRAIAEIPLSVPYAQMILVLLTMHCVLSPLVILTSATHWFWGGVFCFVSVFSMLTIQMIAQQIEHPFGDDSEDIDLAAALNEMNRSLVSLTGPQVSTVPGFTISFKDDNKRKHQTIAFDHLGSINQKGMNSTGLSSKARKSIAVLEGESFQIGRPPKREAEEGEVQDCGPAENQRCTGEMYDSPAETSDAQKQSNLSCVTDVLVPVQRHSLPTTFRAPTADLTTESPAPILGNWSKNKSKSALDLVPSESVGNPKKDQRKGGNVEKLTTQSLSQSLTAESHLSRDAKTEDQQREMSPTISSTNSDSANDVQDQNIRNPPTNQDDKPTSAPSRHLIMPDSSMVTQNQHVSSETNESSIVSKEIDIEDEIASYQHKSRRSLAENAIHSDRSESHPGQVHVL